MYVNGQGVPQDYAEALKWYHLASDQGYADAQFSLGGMYADGRGAPRDYVLAHMWLNLSAAHGNQRAAEKRNTIARRMTSAQIAKAQKLAREWRPKWPDRTRGGMPPPKRVA
jgi:TPR repeat protein